MTLDKAKRILPSFATQLASGVTDIAILRQRVEVEARRLTQNLLVAISATHSGSYATAEAKAIDLKLEQLNRFLEMTR